MEYKNEVEIWGDLFEDPKVSVVGANQSALAKFKIVTKRTVKKKDGDEAEIKQYHSVTAWRAEANRLESAKKGDFIKIKGSIEYGSYDNKEGKKVYTTDIIVSEVIEVQHLGERTSSNGVSDATIVEETAFTGDNLPF